MTIDLVLIGPSTSPSPEWSFGNVYTCDRTAPGVVSIVEQLVASGHSEAVLFWDTRLAVPNGVLANKLLAGRGDVWHAGLLLGTQNQPGLMDFVAPNWILIKDGPSDREVTSWRVAFEACLVRTEVFRQLGAPCADFETLSGAALEWGHRAVCRGVMLRHCPALVANAPLDEINWAAQTAPLLADEVRFVAYRYGRLWTRWALGRAAVSDYASAGDLLSAWREIPQRRPYEDRIYRSERVIAVPDLASCRVSVLIPTLNRYPYLHVVLENLLAQTVRPHEVIVVDQTAREKRDDSIATKFSALPLKLIYQDSPGQCASRNAGLNESTGDYILFIDDDDELGPTLIEDHLRNLHRYGADVSSGVAQEVGTAPLPEAQRFTRAADVFPTNNSLVRRDVLRGSGLFDLAFNRAPRADGDLGIRIYHSGAFMVLDQSIAVMHHHASEGGLRTHGARVITYRLSREMLAQRHLPHISEIYLASRYFTPRQQRENLWLRVVGTLSGRGSISRRLAKAAVGVALLPDSLQKTLQRRRIAAEWLTRFPQISDLER